jgi:hypothetical protein
VNCGPGHIQCSYSTAYSVFSIQPIVSALLLEISPQFTARYTAILMPNIAHVLQFSLCELWSYTKYLPLRICRLQYSTESICAAIGDISTIQCALYCKIDAKYCAYPPVYAVWTVVSVIYNEIIAPHIQDSIFNSTYLHCYRKYLDNSMRVIPHTWCQIQHTSLSLRYVNCGPGHIQCSCSSAYSGFSIKLNVSALILEISRQFNARYAVNLVPNTAHMLQSTLWELLSRAYTMYLKLRIFSLQY